jgi:hypothetical protein
MLNRRRLLQVTTALPSQASGDPRSRRLSAVEDRPIVGEFHEERIVGRPWRAKEGHMTILELTG